MASTGEQTHENPSEPQPDAINELPRSQFEELKFLITNMGTQINGRIDSLERKFVSDVAELRNDDRKLAQSIETNLINTETEFAAIRNQLVERDNEADDRTRDLEEANHQITILSNKLINLEKDSYRGLQHGREWNVEIDGIPANIGDQPQQLQTAVVTLLTAINVPIDAADIDTVHRLPSKNEIKPVIVRFHSRKWVRCIHENKNKLKDLADLNVEIAGLHPESRIYIRPSLCSYYKNLAYNCRLLKRGNFIENQKVSNDGKITIKTLDGSFVKIMHETDLKTRFTRFEKFDFNSGNDR